MPTALTWGLVALDGPVAHDEGALAAADGETDLIDDVEVEIGDIGDDVWRLVDLAEHWGNERATGYVIELPRLVADGQGQRVGLAHGIHDAGGEPLVASWIGDENLLSIRHANHRCRR